MPIDVSMTKIDMFVDLKLADIKTIYFMAHFDKEMLRNAILDVSNAFLEISEIGTTNRGYWLDKFAEDLRIQKGLAWCLLFVQFAYKFSSNLWKMKDCLPYDTAATQQLWNKANANRLTYTDYSLIKPADIIIWRKGLTNFGHTGIIMSAYDKTIETIEGNTTTTFSRDGGSVKAKTYDVLQWGPVGKSKKTSTYLRGFISFDKLFEITYN
jgi:hypothetical protein